MEIAMKILTVWDIRVWDGGDRHDHKYYVATKEAAEEWKKNNPYDSIWAKELLIFDDLEDIKHFNLMQARQKALDKLTDEEKRALGVSDISTSVLK